MTASNLLGPEIAVLLSDIVGVDSCNSRGDESGDAFRPEIEQLAATLRACGQVHPLILRPAEVEHRWNVLVGGRAWRALQLEASRSPDAPRVRARVFNGDDEAARALSLAENFARRALHPLDEAKAFAALAREMSVGRVARDFGVTERFVRKRLALGALSDKVAAAWRDGRLSEASAKAFTVCAGHAAQDEALARFSAPHLSFVLDSPRELRDRLRGEAAPATAPAALFVGLGAYLAAGGHVADDLFEEASFWIDGALLKRLERDKLEAIGELIRTCEGWGFAQAGDPESRLAAVVGPDLTDAEMARLDALEDEIAALALDDERYQPLFDEIDRLDSLGALRATTADERGKLGVLVYVDGAGALAIERGMRRLADEADAAPSPRERGEGGAPAPDEGQRDAGGPRDGRLAAKRAAPETIAADFAIPVPAAARRIAEAAGARALAAAVAANPALAAVLALASLASGRHPNPIGLYRHVGPRGVKNELAMRTGRAPSLREALAIAAAAPPNEVLVAIYDCLAASVDLRGRIEADNRAALECAAVLSPGLNAAIAEAFDHAAYFSSASRPCALAAIRECGGAAHEMAAGWRVDDALAQEAAQLTRAKGWLPEFLRPPGWLARSTEAAE